jgi:hypothetical protein
MAMPEMQPKAVVLRCRPDDRQHVRHAGPDPAPGYSLHRSAEVEQTPRNLFRAFELNRRRQPGLSGPKSAQLTTLVAPPKSGSLVVTYL